MLTVMYDDDMPTADELDQLSGTLLAGGDLGSDEAAQVARVLRLVADGLKRTVLTERISDEGFD